MATKLQLTALIVFVLLVSCNCQASILGNWTIYSKDANNVCHVCMPTGDEVTLSADPSNTNVVLLSAPEWTGDCTELGENNNEITLPIPSSYTGEMLTFMNGRTLYSFDPTFTLYLTYSDNENLSSYGLPASAPSFTLTFEADSACLSFFSLTRSNTQQE